MDERVATCVAASLAWYADVFALHGIPTETQGGLWRALGPPPPLHSAAKTLRPGVSEADVLAAVAPYDACTVADSYGDLDLSAAGFRVFIDATWLLHRPLEPAPVPDGWRPVADEDELAAWVTRHGTPGVFPPAVLTHPAFSVLTRDDGAGVVLHAGGGAVSVSHAFGDVTVADALALAAALRPGLPVTDYATDAVDLVAAGFEPLGPQVVWRRG